MHYIVFTCQITRPKAYALHRPTAERVQAENKRLATSMSNRDAYTTARTGSTLTHIHIIPAFTDFRCVLKAPLSRQARPLLPRRQVQCMVPVLLRALRAQHGVPAAPPRTRCGHLRLTGYHHLREVLCTMTDAAPSRPQRINASKQLPPSSAGTI